MLEDEVKQLIEAGIAGAEVLVQSNGNSFRLNVVSDIFDGLSPLKRQQLVYVCINEKIKSGEVHAVTMQLYAPNEWVKKQKFSL